MSEATAVLDSNDVALQPRGWRGHARAVWVAGLPHVIVASVAVSGLTYLQQFVTARLLSPADFGVVRTIETMLAVLLLLGACGTPTLAIRLVPEAPAARHPALLRQLMGLAMAGCAILALIMIAWSMLQPPAAIAEPLRIAIWALVFSAGARVVYNFQQGLLRVREVSWLLCCAAIIALVVTIALTAGRGLQGWAIGRVTGEFIILATLLWFVRATVRARTDAASGHSLGTLIHFGAAITLSFAFRSAVDGAGLWVLNARGADAAEIGYLGLATLLLTATLLIPGGFSALVLPRMVQRRAGPPAASVSYMWWAMRWAAASTLPFCVLGTLLLPFLLAALLPAYAAAAATCIVFLWVAPLRAAGAMAGNQLLAVSNVRSTIVLNAIGVALLAALAWRLARTHGAIGVGYAAFLTEVFLLTLTSLAARRAMRAPVR